MNDPGLEQRRLAGLLKATSRSFYRSLAVLPAAVRPQISLAYLLARTSDTIADTEVVPAAERLTALAALRSAILGEPGPALEFRALRDGCSLPAEKLLLECVEDSVRLLGTFDTADQALIREVERVIIGGQELDLRRFPVRQDGVVAALETEADLDDYAFRVAGCVGEFWTQLTRRRLFPHAPLDEAAFLRDGIRFGKGLQYVNILRDLPRDLRQGRCYLPRQTLAAGGFAPEQLLDATAMERFRPLYNKWLNDAQAHLTAGWAYTCMLPPGQSACGWPAPGRC